MLAKRIIPCLDVKEGRVVKGVKFEELKDAGDPVQNACFYDQHGADELVLLDITASHEKRGILIDIVRKTAESIFMPLTVGGGVRSEEDVRELLLAGADKVSFNTAAVNNPSILKSCSERFGSQCIVVAIDAKRSEDKKTWMVYTHGGRKLTDKNAIEWAKECVSLGAGEILLTSMDTDGTQAGYDVALLSEISRNVRVPVIASGGAGNLEHLYDAFDKGKADAVLAASIFHYRTHTVTEAKQYLRNKGIPVRL